MFTPMPSSPLTSAQEVALLYEMGAVRNLLEHGVDLIRSATSWDASRDPILAVVAMGVEKMYKLALGALDLEATGSWTNREQMQKTGHGIAAMHEKVIAELERRAEESTQHVRDVMAVVENDSVSKALIEVIDIYARQGRYYYLDILGGQEQVWFSPQMLWIDVCSTAGKSPKVMSAMAQALAEPSRHDLWEVVHGYERERIADALTVLWRSVVIAGMNGLLGQHGRVLGAEIAPKRSDITWQG